MYEVSEYKNWIIEVESAHNIKHRAMCTSLYVKRRRSEDLPDCHETVHQSLRAQTEHQHNQG